MYSTNKKIFEQYSLFGKALANSNRLEIMSLLMQSPKTVERIAKDTNLSVANVSKHLQMLLKVHLVKNRKYKNYIYYEVINKDIENMLTIFFETAQNQLENLSEIETVFSNSNEYVLTIEDLEKRLSAKDIVLIDVRPSEEYLTAHIPGAISIPLQDLESMIEKLPKDKEIVAYCRGPRCLMSKEAITILKEHGRQAVQFNQSVNDWNLHSMLQ